MVERAIRGAEKNRDRRRLIASPNHNKGRGPERREGRLSDQFEQPVQCLAERFRVENRDLLAKAVNGNGPIWEIFTHDALGSAAGGRARVNGNPALCGWLVMAIAITVSDLLLNTSWLRIRTGRSPDCSRPLTGSKSAQ